MLKDIIGCDRTIMIACPECKRIFSEDEFESTYLCPGGMLRKFDYLQKDSIFYHVNVNLCDKIIVAGHYGCRILHHSLPYRGEWKVDDLLTSKTRNFQGQQISDCIATEQNVLEQIRILGEFPFIRSKIQEGMLNISGIIIDDNYAIIKEIYKNGVTYNDLIGSN